MNYDENDFLETADHDTLEKIARARELTRKYYFSDYNDRENRNSILMELLGSMGKNVAIDTPFYCDYGKNIFLGNDVIINMNCTFVDNKPIRIGNKVLIASNVQIYTSSHPVLPLERLVSDWEERKTTFFRTYARPVEIGNNVWIGGGSILLPGVTIGENSVIGAGSVVNRSIPANCVAVGNPCRVIRYFSSDNERQKKSEKWLEWAVELQSLAQAGLTYGNDVYDKERYQRIRDISAEILAYKTDFSLEKVKNLFCNEIGYQTPKLDTRAAIFNDGKILLVRENNGKWSLPGGWVDVNLSIKENTIKEVKEEAGLDVTADKIIAVQDRAKHNLPLYAYGVCKIFVLCSVMGGHFENNIETTEFQYFDENNLPELATEKNNEEQVRMCFEAYLRRDWVTVFD
ncbi:2,3,4,5-tetrahydropyridine-2,6-dicarboxylate N-acetyltransferase [Eubacterium plexicaudatum ASF492]|jgi:acetyltransferase-like isoleucine patch superfamily enzyme/ADP-ribose pyrophosphatase YjhB (NUDIX family)|uniref:Nudix hydrolase domain-containing protein n=1 Tax=Eubacterium plexicaudatum ASF492 TaxID=1235802 RepID=N1ZZQ8_9FIRM|nr:2,3,4,5-tetrahydropyridine-2,6-dicarboxylate N-acetyltransferase [Eubacterium plexicaudatum ASF492]